MSEAAQGPALGLCTGSKGEKLLWIPTSMVSNVIERKNWGFRLHGTRSTILKKNKRPRPLKAIGYRGEILDLKTSDLQIFQPQAHEASSTSETFEVGGFTGFEASVSRRN